MAAPETALTVRRIFVRAPAELLTLFGKVPTGNVCDAQGRRRELFYERRSTHASLRQAARSLKWGDGWDPEAVPLDDGDAGEGGQDA